MIFSQCLRSITMLGILASSLPAQSPMPVVAPAPAKAASAAFRATILADRPDALYGIGETVVFTLMVTHHGEPVGPLEIEWTLTKDGVAPVRTGRVKLEQGRARISGKLDEPGFLQCRVVAEIGGTKLTALGGAGVAPLEIKPSAPAPADFDAFWQAKKQALAMVPVNARLTAVKSPRDGLETYDLQADSVGAPVSGYFARPIGAAPRSLPAILTVHGAGVRSAGLTGAAGWAREGMLALDINAHGLPNGRDADFYTGLAAGELKDYRKEGIASRESVYFLGMFLRLVRAIDFLTAQPEWDGRTVIVYGSSQGGAQAIAAAGIDSRVSYFVAGVPAMCDHTGGLAGRIAGWPKFITTGQTPSADVVAAIKYYDAVNFAALAKAPGFFTVGFIDTTCPPTSVYAAYNALSASKQIFNDITSGHTNTPAASAAMRAAALRHAASQRNASQ
jgi:cephalosporin-C deacetylase